MPATPFLAVCFPNMKHSYENSQITAVNMNRVDLNSAELIRYPIILKGEINYQN